MGTTASGGHSFDLFTPVQQRLLAALFGQTDRRFASAELIRIIDSGTGAVLRQLGRLVDAGVVTVAVEGNRKFYQANHGSPIFSELQSIVLKTIGMAEPLRDALMTCQASITIAFVFGSIAKGTATAASDIDLMVLSDSLDYATVFGTVQAVEQILSRRINPTVMPVEEWQRKRGNDNSFAARVAAEPKIWVIGSDAELP
jgi:predicted nucleotidyltransferase